MGTYNCKECLGNFDNQGKEILINKAPLKKETASTLRPSLLYNNKNNKSKNNNNKNNLRKEEKDNNILLKNELNKINDISKIIEAQKKQIKSQEKIIEEYKNKESLYIEQQKQMELTQRIIREQQEILNKGKTKQGLPISKSTPLIKSFWNNNQINNKEKTKPLLNEENQIEEDDNYERIEVYEEEDKINNDMINPLLNNRFKIETYEPIETGNKNDENSIMSNYKVINNINLEPRDSYKKGNTDKKVNGPLDKGKNEVNINFRGTFENKQNEEMPRDSQRSLNNNYEINNNYNNINEVLIQPEDQYNKINNENQNINIFNNNENNNIYLSQEFNMNIQQESPKFNCSKYNEDINSSLKGPYLKDTDNINNIDNIKVLISAPLNYNVQDNPLIYTDDIINTNFQ